ncbi:diphthine methyltransferase homolog [Phalaenopsis equestris]|uniref:diphthine methyltransferase homolog n=1 Tax=Phalaenopsis equestris TaxID=78828 RepID=UPI0009E55598|nr:diphthine methyltransferase homolog [Phalaenopsis equestris]XP_020573581.1 diphthine methyltransferase homolog [Phalaenopsis equestris]XP_020573582.1 diphthine methyltransferase homolog [Phalaenopsis equestris]
MDIASSDLDGNADAVEFCTNPTFHHLLAAATYTLQEDEVQPIRTGSISLFSATSSGLKLLDCVHAPGIFDIKWNPSVGEAGTISNSTAHHPLLAQATSDGFLTLYSLHPTDFSLLEVCKEEVSSSMCLCVNWDSSGSSTSVGLSDGWVSTLVFREDRLQITQSWAAHEFETWAVLPDSLQPQLLYTGSDDCSFSCWDLRQNSSSSTVFRNTKSHKMGVCCIAQCPSDSNMLLTGSYDEFIRVWDVRCISRPFMENSLCLGGGVWRLKYHSLIKGLVLAACMHSGFAIVKIDGENINILETYTKHDSLAYGADWQRAECVKDGGRSGLLVATCSFYDRLLRLWKPYSLK